MRVFLDTNILLDIVEQRRPHFADSFAVFERCELRAHRVFIAWHTLSNAFYIYSKKVGAALAMKSLEDALLAMNVATVDHSHAQRAFALGFADLEDAMQAVAAESCGADLIVTRNKEDFFNSPVPAFTPVEFLARFP